MRNRVTQTRRRWLEACGVAVGGMVVSGCMGGEEGDESDDNGSGSNSEWPMYGVDLQNTGHHPTATGPKDDIEVKWTYDTDEPITSSPVLGDGTIYVTSQDGYLHAIDSESGEGRWSLFSDGRHTPGINDGIVYSGVKALDTETGDVLWEADERLDVSAPVDGGVIVTHRLEVLKYEADANEDRELETLSWENRSTSSPPAIDDGIVYTMAGPTFRAIDMASGETEWEFEQPDGERMSSGAPAITDGSVYIGDNEGYLRALDAKSGQQRWEYDAGSTIKSSPSVVDGKVYLVTSWEIVVIDAESGDVDRTIEDRSFTPSTKPVIVDNVLYIDYANGAVAIDLNTDSRLWEFQADDSIRAPPTLSGGVAYVPSRDGSLYALEEA